MAIHIGPVKQRPGCTNLFCRIFDDDGGGLKWQNLKTSDWNVAVKRRDALREKAMIQHLREASQPIGEALDDWLRWYCQSDLALSTIENAQYAANTIARGIGASRQLGEITSEDLQRFSTELSRSFSRSTCQLVLTYMRQAYKWFMATGRVNRDPSAIIRLPKAEPRGIGAKSGRDIPDKDLFRILDKISTLSKRRGHEARSIFETMAWSGIRYGTLEQLEWGHIVLSPERPSFAIPGRLIKTRRPLVVPMHEKARQAILHRWAGGDTLRQGGRIWPNARTIKRLWSRACRELGLSYQVHDLRGRYENWLRRAGIKPEVYMFLLGRRDAAEMMKAYLAVHADEAMASLREAGIHKEIKDAGLTRKDKQGG